MFSKKVFDLDCKACKRLDDFLCDIKKNIQIIVHVGRPFTGDYVGILLYQIVFYGKKTISLMFANVFTTKQLMS